MANLDWNYFRLFKQSAIINFHFFRVYIMPSNCSDDVQSLSYQLSMIKSPIRLHTFNHKSDNNNHLNLVKQVNLKMSISHLTNKSHIKTSLNTTRYFFSASFSIFRNNRMRMKLSPSFLVSGWKRSTSRPSLSPAASEEVAMPAKSFLRNARCPNFEPQFDLCCFAWWSEGQNLLSHCLTLRRWCWPGCRPTSSGGWGKGLSGWRGPERRRGRCRARWPVRGLTPVRLGCRVC